MEFKQAYNLGCKLCESRSLLTVPAQPVGPTSISAPWLHPHALALAHRVTVDIWLSPGQLRGFPGGSAGKESACNAGDHGSIPRLGRLPGERDRLPTPVFMGFLGFRGGSNGKKSACNIGDLGSIPVLGRSPGEGIGYPLQCSGLENSIDRGAW